MTILSVFQKFIDATPSPAILRLLENLNVDIWQCLAELIDNPLDDFKDAANPAGRIDITIDGDWLHILDNGSGMNRNQLENAVRAGYSDKNKYDALGLFGVGFNVATSVLGRRAVIKSKPAGAQEWLSVDVDLNKMIRDDSFKLELHELPAEDTSDSGTQISILLKPEHISAFKNKRRCDAIKTELGKAYSYILRNEVPGLTGINAGESRSVEITFLEDIVKPRIPCIWSEDRSVVRNGETIEAVQKFDVKLPDAAVCNACGLWHQNAAVTMCSQCGEESIVIRERSVWGWIGVQRYIDEGKFGIDFIRNGRTIVADDKNIFRFQDPDTGEAGNDYPIEMPANRGRLVGEVHCDHVPVDFIKTSFDQNDAGWIGLKDVIRGHSSMRPRIGVPGDQAKPMPKLFRAFRRNDPGLTYLTTGNGEKASHVQSVNWAKKFYDNDPDYLTDKNWYDACVSHDKLAAAAEADKVAGGGVSVSGGIPVSGKPKGPAATKTKVTSSVASGSTASSSETIQDKMLRWKSGGVKRSDLSILVTPACVNRTYTVQVWVTNVKLDGINSTDVAVHAEPIQGSEIHVFVNKTHEVIAKFGRNVVDLALMELAIQIRNLSNTAAPVPQIYADLLKHFPDEEKSQKILKDRVVGFTALLSKRIRPYVSVDPEIWWTDLQQLQKTKAEQDAVAKDPTLVWEDALATGEFAEYLSLDALNTLVKGHPEEVMDGKVFRPIYATAVSKMVQEQSHGYITEALDRVNALNSLPTQLNDYQRAMLDVTLQYLDDNIVLED